MRGDPAPILRGLPEGAGQKELLEAVLRLSRKRLTKNQKRVLKKVAELENEITMSALLRGLSAELCLGESTVRVILQTLRDVNLIVCGDAGNKGLSVGLTLVGEIVMEDMNGH
ncbi:MAG: hypothetical protein ABIG20_01440 [archaeon]